jgi:F0F1-type ATP synthase delta subunit
MPLLQNKVKTYASVLVGVLDGKTEREAIPIIDRFNLLLKKRGDLKLAGRVLQAFKKLWAQKDGKVALVIGTQKLTDENKNKIKVSLENKGFVVNGKSDQRILGGIAIFVGEDFLIDWTIRNKIKRLWQNFNK